MAVRCLTNLLPVLTGEQCKRAASRLELHEFQREPFDEITGREKEWQRKTFPLTVRLRENFKELVLGEKPLGQLFVPDVEKEYRTRTLEVRRVMLTAASRAFELDRGRRPQRASELVPDYLRAVPTDPASLAPIELRGGEHD